VRVPAHLLALETLTPFPALFHLLQRLHIPVEIGSGWLSFYRRGVVAFRLRN
jgi:hypothetical protein